MSEGRPASPARSQSPRSGGTEAREAAGAIPIGLRLFDAILIGFFLALVFLLGVFQLRDTADFYWHLRTGDLIRASGEIPRVDFYTYTRAGSPWIDLHWMFQVGMSWVHDHGGVPALTFAKCAVTAAAMLLQSHLLVPVASRALAEGSLSLSRACVRGLEQVRDDASAGGHVRVVL